MISEPVVTTPEEWAAYDELPEEVRALLATRVDPYEPLSMLERWRECQARGLGLADFLHWLRQVLPRGVDRRR